MEPIGTHYVSFNKHFSIWMGGRKWSSFWISNKVDKFYLYSPVSSTLYLADFIELAMLACDSCRKYVVRYGGILYGWKFYSLIDQVNSQSVAVWKGCKLPAVGADNKTADCIFKKSPGEIIFVNRSMDADRAVSSSGMAIDWKIWSAQ